MDSVTVRVLHNQNESQSFDVGYRHGDPLIEVYEGKHRFPYKDPEALELSLEQIFEQNQWAEKGSVHPWYPDARSLSVGDVIVLHHKAYACERVGFREINPVDAGIEELIA